MVTNPRAMRHLGRSHPLLTPAVMKQTVTLFVDEIEALRVQGVYHEPVTGNRHQRRAAMKGGK